MPASEGIDETASTAPARRRPLRRHVVLGVIAVAVGLVAAGVGWVVVRPASSDRERLWSSGFSCRGDLKMARASVDHTGPLTGDATAELAVDRYISGPGVGLPPSGYHEVAQPPGELEGVVPPSSIDPTQGTTEPQALRYFVHPSGRGVDVSLRLQSSGAGWTVVVADYCVSTKP